MLRWLFALSGLAVVLAIAVAAHAYIVQRMVVDAGLATPWASLATGLVWTGFVAMLL